MLGIPSHSIAPETWRSWLESQTLQERYPLKVLSGLAVILCLFSPTDLVFVRHGETVANATGHYNSKTLNAFSDKGQAEVDALTKRLVGMPRFQLILVSPSPRAMLTIAPYLKQTRQKATVWPLLYECCTGKRPKDATPTSFKLGAKIKIPSDLAPYFNVVPGADRLPVASDYRSGLAQVDASLAEFKDKFAGQRVLLVGHSGHGGQFLHALTGKWRRVENCKEIAVRLP